MFMILLIIMMLMTVMMVTIVRQCDNVTMWQLWVVTRAYARQEPSWNENVYRFEQVGHNDVEEELNDVDDEDDGHHRALQVAVLKEELLGDKGYEDIHCQVDLDDNDHADDYADDVDGEDDDGADYVSQEKDLACQELLCPLGWQWSSQREECSLKKGDPS